MTQKGDALDAASDANKKASDCVRSEEKLRSEAMEHSIALKKLNARVKAEEQEKKQYEREFKEADAALRLLKEELTHTNDKHSVAGENADAIHAAALAEREAELKKQLLDETGALFSRYAFSLPLSPSLPLPLCLPYSTQLTPLGQR